MDRNSGPNKYHLASPKLFISLKSNTQVNKQTDKQTSKQKELKERKNQSEQKVGGCDSGPRFWHRIFSIYIFGRFCQSPPKLFCEREKREIEIEKREKKVVVINTWTC